MVTTELQLKLRAFNEAFASNDIDAVLSMVTDDIEWAMAGDHTIVGKDNMAHALREMASNEIMTLTIHNIITHGRTAAVNGELQAPNGGSRYGFCDVYQLNGLKDPKIKVLTSYVAELVD
ncbi:MAG: nuclear transport factor 2 family protein [Natronospirillum sp.]